MSSSAADKREDTRLVLFQSSQFLHEAIVRILSRDGRSLWHKGVFAKQAKGDKAGNSDGEMAQRGSGSDVGDIGGPHRIHLFVLVHLTGDKHTARREKVVMVIPCHRDCVSSEYPTSHGQAVIALKCQVVGGIHSAVDQALSGQVMNRL
jgi:hypothetical protein